MASATRKSVTPLAAPNRRWGRWRDTSVNSIAMNSAKTAVTMATEYVGKVFMYASTEARMPRAANIARPMVPASRTGLVYPQANTSWPFMMTPLSRFRVILAGRA